MGDRSTVRVTHIGNKHLHSLTAGHAPFSPTIPKPETLAYSGLRNSPVGPHKRRVAGAPQPCTSLISGNKHIHSLAAGHAPLTQYQSRKRCAYSGLRNSLVGPHKRRVAGAPQPCASLISGINLSIPSRQGTHPLPRQYQNRKRCAYSSLRNSPVGPHKRRVAGAPQPCASLISGINLSIPSRQGTHLLPRQYQSRKRWLIPAYATHR